MRVLEAQITGGTLACSRTMDGGWREIRLVGLKHYVMIHRPHEDICALTSEKWSNYRRVVA